MRDAGTIEVIVDVTGNVGPATKQNTFRERSLRGRESLPQRGVTPGLDGLDDAGDSTPLAMTGYLHSWELDHRIDAVTSEIGSIVEPVDARRWFEYAVDADGITGAVGA